jgi:predicted kinase
MKNYIKQILRENTAVNSLGVKVTRPTQELIIMRGIPGSGKSTKAKSLIGKGAIHSTDDVISASGDYKKFFADMVAANDFSRIGNMHKQNLQNAIQSMESGVTPVIIDNTNIRAFEPKAYIQKALELGYDDNNIRIVDIGTGGASAEELAKRNTHGVPLDKIKSMIDTHRGVGDLTIDKIMQAENTTNEKKVLYSAVVLDDKSHKLLLDIFSDMIPPDWKTFAHHMTIAFGKGVENPDELGTTVTLKVVELGISDMAIAARVEGYKSNNAIPHITLAINPNGGKPVMSNQIKDWKPIKNFDITGIVTNIMK